MSIYKRGGQWWIYVSIRKAGKKIRSRKPGGKTKAEAIRAEALERGRLESMTANAHKPPYFSAFADDFMTTYAKAHNKPSELASKQMIVDRHLKPAFAHLRLDEIHGEPLDRYKAAKLAVPLKPKSVNNHLTCLATMLNVAEEWGYLHKAPRIRKLKVPDPTVDFLTFDEAAKLIYAAQHLPPRSPWRIAIMLALRAGLRISEIISLRWRDVDLCTTRIVVRTNVWRGIEGTPKGDRTAEVPVSAELATVLLEQAEAGDHVKFVLRRADSSPYTRDECTRPIAHLCRAAGIREVGWHVLRHTFASHLVMRGVPLKTVQELMRHRSIASTMRYAHLTPEAKTDAVELLSQPPPVGPQSRHTPRE